MKKIGKPVSIIIAVVIIAFAALSIFGISSVWGDSRNVYIKGLSDIRWGIDINGGLDVTFSAPDDVDATESQMDAAKAVIEQRLVNLNITDSEVYIDNNKDRIIVRFPWKSDEEDFDPEKAIAELGTTAELTFRKGTTRDDYNYAAPTIEDELVISGNAVDNAEVMVNTETNEYVIQLTLNDAGKESFAAATKEMKNAKGYISIWMDDTCISSPDVQDEITDGIATISGSFTASSAKELADKINAGALPFALKTDSFSTISPSLGNGAKNAMGIAGIVAFAVICILMISLYRLPGVVASICLLGQIAGTLACISGFFPSFDSFTLTIPGIAGIILSIGMGVDCYVITAERIKDELKAGKTLNGAISVGYHKAFSSILDGNVTVVVIALILMGAFGPTDSFIAKALSWVFFMFGPATTGAIYSFGYTLFIGFIMNFIFGIFASKLMLRSVSRFDSCKKLSLYRRGSNV